MKIKDFYPNKGTYTPEDPITFILEIEELQGENDFEIIIYSQGKIVKTKSILLEKNFENKCKIEIDNDFSLGGYAIQIKQKGSDQLFLSAFDVQETWSSYPRYGFLSQFPAELTEDDVETKIQEMAKYHINGIQFYDWQYRHDQLIPPTDVYIDPLGRELSMLTIDMMIEKAHQSNMVAMPYLAIYGASIEFWKKHPDWGLYDQDGKPLLFEDFLGLMNPTQNSAWCEHLEKECQKIIENTNFDGLHIDQYGDPKKAFTKSGEEIDLPKAFKDFINQEKEKYNRPVLFNAVGNWPIESLATSDVDFVYIEVWEPTPKFIDLQKIIENARNLSQNKAVVIPIYIKKQDWTNVLIANAVIAASGGTHLELGDGNLLLSDPYFPKSEKLELTQLAILRNYWDFIVSNQFILGPNAKTLNLKSLKINSNSIHMIARENEKWMGLNLIQINEDDQWIEHQEEKQKRENIEIQLEMEKEIENIFFSSPDNSDWRLMPIAYQTENQTLSFTVPSIKHWSLVLIEYKK